MAAGLECAQDGEIEVPVRGAEDAGVARVAGFQRPGVARAPGEPKSKRSRRHALVGDNHLACAEVLDSA